MAFGITWTIRQHDGSIRSYIAGGYENHEGAADDVAEWWDMPEHGETLSATIAPVPDDWGDDEDVRELGPAEYRPSPM